MQPKSKYILCSSLEQWRSVVQDRGLNTRCDIYEGSGESGPCAPTGGLIAVGADAKEYGYFDLFETEDGVVFEDAEDYFAYTHCAFEELR